jgi:hypothetical protein
MTERVVLEVAPKRAFASALDWPGWSRSGRTEDDALRALLDHGPRFAEVARRAGLPFRAPSSVRGLEIVERIPGGGVTEFGAPGKAATAEEAPISATDLDRLHALMSAAWAAFDDAAKRARGVQLATGPRGGGRDLAKIVDHVRGAEVAYLAKLGSRAPASAEELRATFTAALTAAATGQPVADPSRTRKLWPPRYAVRRAAWHVLDHAWEIEDRSPAST